MGSGFRIMLLTWGGAMGIRTPDLLHAMQWQHVHSSASVQVTVSGRPHQSPRNPGRLLYFRAVPSEPPSARVERAHLPGDAPPSKPDLASPKPGLSQISLSPPRISPGALKGHDLRCRSVTRLGLVRLRLGFHLRKTGVVVRELVEMRPRDLRRHGDIVTGHIRLRIPRAMLELDVHPLPELLQIERRSAPVDADPLARSAGLIEGKTRVRSHAVNTTVWTVPPVHGDLRRLLPGRLHRVFQLANDLPAANLAPMPGIHISVAKPRIRTGSWRPCTTRGPTPSLKPRETDTSPRVQAADPVTDVDAGGEHQHQHPNACLGDGKSELNYALPRPKRANLSAEYSALFARVFMRPAQRDVTVAAHPRYGLLHAPRARLRPNMPRLPPSSVMSNLVALVHEAAGLVASRAYPYLSRFPRGRVNCWWQ